MGVSAQDLKVDINVSGRWWYKNTAPGYQAWNTNYAWFGGGDTTSATFNGVTVTFTRVGSNGTGLDPSYWKDAAEGESSFEQLIGDGIKVDNGYVGPAQIEMRLSGLTPGAHTLLTYHNDWGNHLPPSTISPLDIFVDGIQQVTNLPITVRTNSPIYASAYLSLEAVGGQDVVVLFAADTSTPATYENVWIDGFEIDTPNSILKASKPSPENTDEHADADSKSLLLSWTAAASAVSHDVYFGTDSNTVRNATHTSSEFKGNQTATNYLATNISSLLTYYWRVDEVDAGAVVTPGDVWMFRSRHLAFPGAEGYGRFARGGRGGVVVKVTNLDDSGPGSLRDAVKGNYGPRTVVFDVAGLITLDTNDVIINEDYITVAGQTAPGKGICVNRQQFGVSGADDLIIRFVRSRPGDISLTTLNASGMAGTDHSIMDHCSVGWGIDEGISTRGADNMTLQRTIISEALCVAGHDKYPPGASHGYAASVGGDIGSLHHNLLAHNEGRNWSLAGGLTGSGIYAGRNDIFNNVVYNWDGRTTDGGTHECNFVNNYYKPGPASSIFTALNPQYDGFPGTQQYYMAGNVMPGHFDVNHQLDGTNPQGTPPYPLFVNAPFFPSYATIDEVTNAYKKVLSDVGCNLPMIDDGDARVIGETIDGSYTYTGSISGRPGLPDSQADVGGWTGLYPTVARPADWDTDDDGMPNWWEEIKGLNPNSPMGDFSDSNGDPDGDEYTNLEDYLHWLALPHADCEVGSFVDIDLKPLTRGFTNNSPVYAVLAQTNGSAFLIGDNKTVRFTPGVSADALGSFSFSVVDAQGYNMTRTVNLRIIAAPAPILGIRSNGGILKLELTAVSGSSNTVQTATELGGWANWTNVTGNGALQLLPLNELTNESTRYFRAYAE